MPRDDTRLRLKQAMDLRCAFLPHPLTKAAERELALAAQRCLACRSKALCDEQLAAGAAGRFGLFCPNTGYIERLRHGSARFR